MPPKRALLAGTFDPPTLGHLDLIQRTTSICDILYVAIAQNSTKENGGLFSGEERQELLKIITKNLPHVKIVLLEGLLVDFAKKNDITFLVRGLRNFSDFEYESEMAFMNKKIGEIETLFLMTDEKYARLSSSLIKEIAQLGHPLHDFIPKEIEEIVYQRFQHRKG